MIPVTKPYLPPRDEFEKYTDEIWKLDQLTNNGPLVKKLEDELKEHLSLTNLWYVTNGTIALQMAIRALELKGEIITTPFSYIATTSSIVWEHCDPIFVDIDPDTCNIDPLKIESLVTPKTSAILATHCFGNACEVESIELLARKYGLKVIYDCAHAFGSKYKGKSLYWYGDISTASFHATKIFHTVEGGAIMSNDEKLMERIWYIRNFGHDGPSSFRGLGINGKNSEFHAAMGLAVLSKIDEILNIRKEQSDYYDSALKGYPVRRPVITDKCDYNYSYYPIIFEKKETLLVALEEFERFDIFPRRYFYPSLTKLDYVRFFECPVCEDISSRILCLPLYHILSRTEQDLILSILLECLTAK